MSKTQIEKYNKRLEALRSERSSFIPAYEQLSDNILGHRGRFLLGDGNKKQDFTRNIYNNKPTMALRTLSSGMMSGITSPARPWFQLGSPDDDLNEFRTVKEWLDRVQAIMYRVFAQSNTYRSLSTLYTELGLFGTGAMGVYEDFENVIDCSTYTAGEYMISVDGRGYVDTMYREYQLSVGQLIKEFGEDNVSHEVEQLWKNGGSEKMIDVVHVIEPNDNRDMMSPLSGNKPVRSIYYEKACKSGQFLRESGFDSFPIGAPRWDVAGSDVYATSCPGMIALGDCKSLQMGEKRMYQGIDMTVIPPMQAPSSMEQKIRRGGLNPGDIVYTDNPNEQISSVYNLRPDIASMVNVNDRVEERISHAFYEDLFLMLSMSDRRNITATEVAEKQSEKLLMLGPVLERLHNELLDKLIDRTFEILVINGVLPVPPPELQNTELKVDYVSVLAQAQRMVSTTGLERVAGFIGNISQMWPDARNKIDSNNLIDKYADSVGVDSSVLRTDDEAAEITAGQAEAAARQQSIQEGNMMADTMKKASEVDGQNVAAMMEQAGLQ